MAKTEFTVMEVVLILRILDSYPTRNRGQFIAIDGLASALELTDAEREACAWTETPINDGAGIHRTWIPGFTVTRELTKQQAKQTRAYVENPPEAAPWARSQKQMYNSIVTKLGGEAIGGDDE